MMKPLRFSQLIALSSILSVAFAQTPTNETVIPQVSTMLGVAYGANVVSPAGKMLAVSAVVNPPTVSTNSTFTTGKGLLFMMDLDIPVNTTSLSTTARTTLLHWFSPSVTLLTNHTLQIPANVTALGGATYISPSPPAGDIAHHYTWILYNEPANFSVPTALAANITSRKGFNLTAFAVAAELGTPIAANYMLVQNTNTTTGTNGTTSGATTTKASGTTTVTASGTASTSAAKATANVAAILKDRKASIALGAAVLIAVFTV